MFGDHTVVYIREGYLSPGMLIVLIVLIVLVVVLMMLLQVGPDHNTDTGHFLALLVHQQLRAASVGHLEANTVVLQNTTDLSHYNYIYLKYLHITFSLYLWFYRTSASLNASNEYFHSCHVLWII